MRNLFHAAIMRYCTDLLTVIAAELTLGIGFFIGFNASAPIYGASFVSIDDFYFILGIVLCVLSVILSAGREFSDHTIRNKLIIGYGKVHVIFAEMLAAAVTATVFFLLCCVPFAMLNPRAIAVLSAANVCKVYALLYAAFLFSAVTAVGLTFLLTHRTYAIILMLGILFGLYMLDARTDKMLRRGAEEYLIEYEHDENGFLTDIPKEGGSTTKNPYYITEKERRLILAAEHCNPGAALRKANAFFQYTYIPEAADAAKQQTYVQERSRAADNLSDILAGQAFVLAVTAVCGVLLFRRKNVR